MSVGLLLQSPPPLPSSPPPLRTPPEAQVFHGREELYPAVTCVRFGEKERTGREDADVPPSFCLER
jgi:hypothetical protein